MFAVAQGLLILALYFRPRQGARRLEQPLAQVVVLGVEPVSPVALALGVFGLDRRPVVPRLLAAFHEGQCLCQPVVLPLDLALDVLGLEQPDLVVDGVLFPHDSQLLARLLLVTFLALYSIDPLDMGDIVIRLLDLQDIFFRHEIAIKD
jgi:hypothetical protein